MPTIPRPQYFAPPPRTTPAAVAAAPHISRAFGAISNYFDRKELERKQQEEKTRILNTRATDAAYGRSQLDLLYGKDGQGGLNALEGKAFLDAFPGFQQQMRELRVNTFSGAKDVDSRALDAAMSSRDNRLMEQVFKGMGAARKKYGQDTREAAINLELKMVQSDAAQFQSAVENIENILLANAEEEGIPPDNPGVQLALIEKTTELVFNAFTAAAEDEDYQFMAELLKRTGDGGDLVIDPAMQFALFERFEDTIVGQQGNKLAEMAYKQFPNSAKDSAAWMKARASDLANTEIGSIFGDQVAGKLFAQARDVYKSIHDQNEDIREEEKKDLNTALSLEAIKGLTFSQLAQQQPLLVANMTPAERNAYDSLVEKVHGQDEKVMSVDEALLIAQFKNDPKMASQLTLDEMKDAASKMGRPAWNELLTVRNSAINKLRGDPQDEVDDLIELKFAENNLLGSTNEATRIKLAHQVNQRLASIPTEDKAGQQKVLDQVFSEQNVNNQLRIDVNNETINMGSVKSMTKNYFNELDIDDPEIIGAASNFVEEEVLARFGTKPTTRQYLRARQESFESVYKYYGTGFIDSIMKGLPYLDRFAVEQSSMFELYQELDADEVSRSRTLLRARGVDFPTKAEITFEAMQLRNTSDNLRRDGDRREVVYRPSVADAQKVNADVTIYDGETLTRDAEYVGDQKVIDDKKRGILPETVLNDAQRRIIRSLKGY